MDKALVKGVKETYTYNEVKILSREINNRMMTLAAEGAKENPNEELAAKLFFEVQEMSSESWRPDVFDACEEANDMVTYRYLQDASMRAADIWSLILISASASRAERRKPWIFGGIIAAVFVLALIFKGLAG